jgi:hypothetical protein
MSSKLIPLTFLALIAILFQNTTGAISLSSQNNDRFIVLRLSDLRSAYLIRAGVVRYDMDTNSADDIRGQLQRHFDVVLGLLLVSTPRSIETALARLEAMDARTWSDGERRTWRQRLLAMRYLQLHRLAAYRDRDQFPLNEEQAAQAVPILVDRHDTACAVGHLMRLSGWSESVARIQTTNNLVYVPDAPRSAVASWVITSGLTWEEAALIQPAYTFAGEHNAADYAIGGQQLEKNGLRFENFQREVTTYVSGPSCNGLPEPCVGSMGTSLGRLGLIVGQGPYIAPSVYPQHFPSGTHFIAIGGERMDLTFPYDDLLQTLHAYSAPGQGVRVVIRFDVSTIDPNARIDGLAQSSYRYQGGFYYPFGPEPYPPFGEEPPNATYYLRTSADDGGASVASLSIDQSTVPTGYDQRLDSESFSPRQKLSIQSEVWLQGGAGIETFLLDFNVIRVPEPASAMLVIVGLVATSVMAQFRRRAN